MRRTLLVILALGVLRGVAVAGPELVVVDPLSLAIDFGAVNVGATSPPIRIQVQNVGDAAVTPEVELFRSPFVIIDEGGSLGPGETAFWDIVARPTIDDLNGLPGSLNITYTDESDEDVFLSVSVSCVVRRVPFDAPVAGFPDMGPGMTATRTITVTNTSATPQTITGFAFGDPTTFTVQPHAGSVPITVPSEGTFELDITFASTLPSHHVDTRLTATLLDGSSADITEVFGGTTGLLSLEDSGGWNGVPLGSTWVRHATLVNYGDTPQTITAVALTDPDFGFTAITTGAVIAAHARVPLDVTFAPSALGPRTSRFTISSSGADDLTGVFDGTGVTPLVRITTEDAGVDDGVLDFGTLELGSAPVTRQVTITNISSQAISTNRCEQFFDAGYTATADCPDFIVLAAGASLQYGVTFTPAHVGDPAGRLTFSANGMNATLELRVYGRVAQHAFELSPPTLAFAETVRHPSAPTTLDLVLTNRGSEALTVPDATIAGAGFTLVASPSRSTLAPGQTATYTLGFAPTAAGNFDAMLVLGPATQPLATVPLHGAGTLRPVSAASALELGAVDVGDTARGSITLHNAGSASITITSLVASDPRFVARLPAYPTVLGGGDLVVHVDYTPSAAGLDAAELHIAFDADPDPQLTVALHGEGRTPTSGGGGGSDDDDGSGGCSARSHGGGLFLLGAILALRRRRRDR